MADSGTGIKELISKAEISLALDTYDDIFSDFDPRPYDVRALSEDFLTEAKRAAREKGSGIELRFLIPGAQRHLQSEELIKRKLKSHFRKHYRQLRAEFARRNKQALAIFGVGVLIGLIDALLLSSGWFNTIARDAIEITMTPASWYTIWTGLDRLFIKPKEEAANEAFYRKMAGASIVFASY